MRVFHATSLKNVDSIKESGLQSRFEGVYFTDSLESACRWIGFRLKAVGETVVAVAEVEMKESELQPGTDHSPLMVEIFGVGASFVGPRKIAKSRIKQWHYFRF